MIKQGIQFDKRITVGNLLSIVTILSSVIGLGIAVAIRLSVIETDIAWIKQYMVIKNGPANIAKK